MLECSVLVHRLLRLREDQEDSHQGTKLMDPPTSLWQQGVSLDDVTFTYPGRKRPVVREVSLHFAANQATAIVGPSGSGKSTVAQLLTQVLQPCEGSIKLGDACIDEISRDWIRRHVAEVPQVCPSFHVHWAHSPVFWIEGLSLSWTDNCSLIVIYSVSVPHFCQWITCPALFGVCSMARPTFVNPDERNPPKTLSILSPRPLAKTHKLCCHVMFRPFRKSHSPDEIEMQVLYVSQLHRIALTQQRLRPAHAGAPEHYLSDTFYITEDPIWYSHLTTCEPDSVFATLLNKVFMSTFLKLVCAFSSYLRTYSPRRLTDGF